MVNELPNLFSGAQFVLGDGPAPCEWMFVGEAPGADEDKIGLPFQGRSGKLLNKTLEYWTTLRRDSVYVTNIVKQRPPRNRDPKVSEIKKHIDYFIEELERVNPKVVITLGGIAFKVFQKGGKVTEDHGVPRAATLGNWSGMLVPWLHPAYALRSPLRMQQLGSDAKRLAPLLALHKVENVDYTLADEERVVWGVVRGMTFIDLNTIGFDTETTSPRHGKVFATDEADMVGWSASVGEGQGWYVPATEFGEDMKAYLESTQACQGVP